MGGTVGITIMVIIYLITHAGEVWWFTALSINAGGSISIFGSYLGSRRTYRA